MASEGAYNPLFWRCGLVLDRLDQYNRHNQQDCYSHCGLLNGKESVPPFGQALIDLPSIYHFGDFGPTLEGVALQGAGKAVPGSR